MSTLATPKTYADELLEIASDALASTVGGPIEYQFVTVEEVSHDCELLAVTMRTIGDAPFGTGSTLGAGNRHITGALNLYGFRVTVVRACQPQIDEGGNFPSAQEHDDAATISIEDVTAIWNAVRQAWRSGELFGGGCSKLFFDGARALAAAGGLAGWEIDFRTDIDGFAVGT